VSGELLATSDFATALPVHSKGAGSPRRLYVSKEPCTLHDAAAAWAPRAFV